MKHLAAIFILMLATASNAENLLAQITSAAYETTSIPLDWIPKVHAASIQSSNEYPRESVKSVQISDFIRIYGEPSRLVVPKSHTGYSYLIYDLADGSKILVYISSPASSTFSAAQLFNSKGEAKGPVLK